MGLKQRSSIVLIGLLKAVEGIAILGLMCAALSLSADAQAVVATVAVGTGPNAVAVNPNTNKIYVANTNPDNPSSVTVIDGATNNTTTVNTTTVVGEFSVAVAVNSVTNQIYVVNGGGVTVIDGATNNTTTVPVGTFPWRRGGEPEHEPDLRRELWQQQRDGD